MKNIGIFATPRSGSTWLGQIFNSSPNVIYRFQPNFAYTFPFEITDNSNDKEISNFFKELLATKDPFVNAKKSISSKKNIEFEKKESRFLVFKETHYLNIVENLIINSDTLVIGLVRSPLAAINSWLKIPREFNPEWSIEEEWRDGHSKNENRPTHYFGYNKWKEATSKFLRLEKEYPKQFYLISYKDLLIDTENEIKKVFEFCGIEYDNQTQEFIRKSTSRLSNDEDVYSVFRSKTKDDKWKTELDEEIINSIKDDLKNTDLEKYIEDGSR